MKIQIASDLHIEFMGRQDHEDLMEQFTGDADVLVLSGDIVPLKYQDQVRDVLSPFCERYKDVVYVPGNHEYYGNNVRDAHLVLGAAQNELYNLHVLKNSRLVVQGQEFYGGTLWFPEVPKGLEHLKDMMNDFSLIQGIEPFCYANYREFRLNSIGKIGKDTVVVSHHLPSYECVADKYMLSPLNRFFVGECDDLIQSLKPKLWIHGHTHEVMDRKIADTRVICNAFGYVHELEDWPKPVIVEV